jgi:hypothetical protein|tara:strand:+ start:672 stop:1391 length:720 start_codon:yes stop_codon:yes gene_type:complete
MAKKTVKKKPVKKTTKKKTVKKKPKKRAEVVEIAADKRMTMKRKPDPLSSVRQLPDRELKARFARKCFHVMHLVPEIDCTGIDDEREYAYTEAHHVYRRYREAFAEVGLTIMPVLDDKTQLLHLGRGMFQATVVYEVTDIDTGYSERGIGVGLGINGVWAANSAQTRAMKQFLIQTFLASWQPPPDLKAIVYQNMKDFDQSKVEATAVQNFGKPINEMTSEEAASAVGSFFENYTPPEK